MVKDKAGNRIKLACWIVVRDDIYYIDMAIKSVLPYVDGVYILDNGSTDGTIELIESFKSDKIVLEKIKYDFDRADFDKGYHTSTHPYWQWNEEYDGNSLEAQTRNNCIKHCVKTFRPDWLIQLDADEVYTPLFFGQLRKYDLRNTLGLRHSTESFITKDSILRRHSMKGKFDPHTRSWNAHVPVRWRKIDKANGHVAPFFNPFASRGPIAWMDGIAHLHLHMSFGEKAEAWMKRKKAEFGRDMYTEKINYNWKGLDFVVEKWKEWGTW